MDIALVHNPKAGGRDVSRRRIEAALRKAGWRPRYFTLRHALAHPEVFDVGEFVAVAGGDGSVRRTALRMIGRNRPLAILPLGTANNIAGSLGIAGSVEEIAAGWAAGRRARLDVGLAVGPWGRRHFLEGVGLGLVGRAIPIIQAIDDGGAHAFAQPEDKLHRDLSVFIALAHELAPIRIGVALDGRKRMDTEHLVLEVLNIARAGPQLELVAAADPCDGYFDVVAVPAADRKKLQRTLMHQLASGGRGPMLAARRARRVRLSLSQGNLRIDDEVVWSAERGSRRTTVGLSIVPGALEVILPGKPRGRGIR